MPITPIVDEHLLIVCGPSGAGKSTLIADLLANRPAAQLSVSYTTRAPRGQEVDGQDYHFTHKDHFLRLIDDQALAEWAEVHGNYYGSPKSTIADVATQHRTLIFDIDFQGAIQLKNGYPLAWSVLIAPPSMAVLSQRLRARATDSESSIVKRLAKATEELSHHKRFDFLVVNHDLAAAKRELTAIFDALALRQHRRALQTRCLESFFP